MDLLRKRTGSGDPPGLQNRRKASSRCLRCVRLAHASAKIFASERSWMIRISHVWIFFAALLAAAQTSPSTGGSTSSKDEEAVRAAEQRFHRDFVQADIKDMDALLTPEFVWMHGNGKVGVKEGLLDAL